MSATAALVCFQTYAARQQVWTLVRMGATHVSHQGEPSLSASSLHPASVYEYLRCTLQFAPSAANYTAQTQSEYSGCAPSSSASGLAGSATPA